MAAPVVKTIDCPFPAEYLQSAFNNNTFLPVNFHDLWISQPKLKSKRGISVAAPYVNDYILGSSTFVTDKLNQGAYVVAAGVIKQVGSKTLIIDDTPDFFPPSWTHTQVHERSHLHATHLDAGNLSSSRSDGKSMTTDLVVGQFVKVLLQLFDSPAKDGSYQDKLVAYQILPSRAEVKEHAAATIKYYQNVILLNDKQPATYLTNPSAVVPIHFSPLWNIPKSTTTQQFPYKAKHPAGGADIQVDLASKTLSALCTVQTIERYNQQHVKKLVLQQCPVVAGQGDDRSWINEGTNWPLAKSTQFPPTLTEGSLVIVYFTISRGPRGEISDKMLALRQIESPSGYPYDFSVVQQWHGQVWQHQELIYWTDYTRENYFRFPFSGVLPPPAADHHHHNHSHGSSNNNYDHLIKQLTTKVDGLATTVHKQQTELQQQQQLIKKQAEELEKLTKLVKEQGKQIDEQKKDIHKLEHQLKTTTPSTAPHHQPPVPGGYPAPSPYAPYPPGGQPPAYPYPSAPGYNYAAPPSAHAPPPY
eukprot:UN00085